MSSAIGERVRDKIAASKHKGIWVGGPVPLGYRVVDKKVVVVPEEAAAVRTTFNLFRAGLDQIINLKLARGQLEAAHCSRLTIGPRSSPVHLSPANGSCELLTLLD